ncbi:run domain Beclin-1-interacting and cysteine-rich domain-containing protein rubicon isoform X3 [Tachypleus tridentatus]|uniref:run domain Beclin-1-interacting and cysteine-rich domain-containing protein rubicon isoform X3 n=1 Tax=Tachypleus tridentatus TaxID=6853 RepID=UPI003FD1EF7E
MSRNNRFGNYEYTNNEKESNPEDEKLQLLLYVKDTVEGLVASCSTNVWNTYGGLSRLCTAVEGVLSHEIKLSQGSGSYLDFILNIKSLKPTLAPCVLSEKLNLRNEATDSQELLTRAHLWLRHSLQQYTLASQLETLVEEKELVSKYYEDNAFLNSPSYTQALILCLKAVERGQPSLLAELDPELLIRFGGSKLREKLKKRQILRSYSCTEDLFELKGTWKTSCVTDKEDIKQPLEDEIASLKKKQQSSLEVNSPKRKLEKNIFSQIRKALSMPYSTGKKGVTTIAKKRCAKKHQMKKHRWKSSAQKFKGKNLEKDGADSSSSSTCEFSGFMKNKSQPKYHSKRKRTKSAGPRLQCASEIGSIDFPKWPLVRTWSFSSTNHQLFRNPVFKDVHSFDDTSSAWPLRKQCSITTSCLSLLTCYGSQVTTSKGNLRRSVSDSIICMSNFFDWQITSIRNVENDISLQIIAKSDVIESETSNAMREPVILGKESSLCYISKELSNQENCSTHNKVEGGNSRTVSILVESQTDEKNWNSVPKSLCNSPFKRDMKKHFRSKSDVSETVNTQPTNTYANITDGTSQTSFSLSSSLPSEFVRKTNRRKSFLEEGGRIVTPKTECFFPQPQKGQSLKGFLSSQDFNACAEMDKENAHFCISEALIGAIEQMKCNQMLQKAEEEANDSDEEIQNLKQRIRIRRRERQQEKEKLRGLTLLSDGKTDTNTSHSTSTTSPGSSGVEPATSSGTEEDVDELDLSDASDSKLSSLKESGLSLSMASLYSDADIKRVSSVIEEEKFLSPEETSKRSNGNYVLETSGSHVSAETVALCLLKRFSEQQLPKASDLQWLVSEQDAPQRLLPLPDSWPISPDVVEEEYNVEKTRLRGNLEWAPPRAQIIFNIHPEPKRKALIAKQNYRCSGCGMKIDRDYIKKFRYCEYLGRYFCQCCHSNNQAYIPGRILFKWDFNRYYVSSFSQDLLEKIFTEPLFNILDINPSLYRKVRQLDLVREYRTQLFYLKDYIGTCRNCERLQEEFDKSQAYLIHEVHTYSIQDLVQVKSGKLPERLRNLMLYSVNHVKQCALCHGKGFICEVCRDGRDIIFPFQLVKVTQCQENAVWKRKMAVLYPNFLNMNLMRVF